MKAGRIAALLLAAALTCMTAQAAGEPRSCAQMDSYWWGVTAHALSAEDRALVERVVMAEAGGGGREGMCGVAQVIRERAESWGMTAREVVTARGQFAAPWEGTVSADVQRAVAMVFDEGYRAFAGYTTHFHADSVQPWWTRSKVLRGEVCGQLFWGLDAA